MKREEEGSTYMKVKGKAINSQHSFFIILPPLSREEAMKRLQPTTTRPIKEPF